MLRTLLKLTALTAAVGIPMAYAARREPPRPAVAIPRPAVDARSASGLASSPATPGSRPDTAVFAGGCFWGIEAVFEHVKGVSGAVSGYAGGNAKSADYETVSSGSTGHAESVQVIYDPSKVSYGTLLRVFFAVAHDPTQLNRQGPDVGPQYRSAIFYRNEEQRRAARANIDQLDQAKAFPRPIVTQLVALDRFYAAEAYHQDYAVNHPNEPYIVYNDAPKVEHLKQRFPELYR